MMHSRQQKAPGQGELCILLQINGGGGSRITTKTKERKGEGVGVGGENGKQESLTRTKSKGIRGRRTGHYRIHMTVLVPLRGMSPEGGSQTTTMENL